MPSTMKPQLSLDEIVSRLNHKMTGTLARLEGLYLLYKLEGQLRDELWEAAIQEAKRETYAELERSFVYSQSSYEPTLQVA